MSRNYKFLNPEGLYFISFAAVGWLDGAALGAMGFTARDELSGAIRAEP